VEIKVEKECKSRSPLLETRGEDSTTRLMWCFGREQFDKEFKLFSESVLDLAVSGFERL
jgi:hypothetical protein